MLSFMQYDEKLGTVIIFMSDQNVSWPSTSVPQNIEVEETHKQWRIKRGGGAG